MVLSSQLEPFNIVLFGGNGDLAIRKLLPSLYRLFKNDHLGLQGFIIGASHTSLSTEEYKTIVYGGLKAHLEHGEMSEDDWQQFKHKLKQFKQQIREIIS